MQVDGCPGEGCSLLLAASLACPRSLHLLVCKGGGCVQPGRMHSGARSSLDLPLETSWSLSPCTGPGGPCQTWVRILASLLCVFPVTALSNYHKLEALQQQKFILVLEARSLKSGKAMLPQSPRENPSLASPSVWCCCYSLACVCITQSLPT